MLLSLIVGGLCVLIVFKIVELLYNRHLYHKLIDKIPGPKMIPIIGFAWELMRVTREDRRKWLNQICNQYNDGLFRIWVGESPTVFIYKPKFMEVILQSNTLITKGKVYKYLNEWLGTGLLTGTGEKWFHNRKLLTPAFHFSILEQHAVIMFEKSIILNECIEKEIKKNPGKPIDIYDFTLKSSLDIFCETALGVNLDLQRKPQNEYFMAAHEFQYVVIKRIGQPWFTWDWLFYKTTLGKEFQSMINTMHQFSKQIIEKKLQDHKNGIRKDDTNDVDNDIEKRKRKAFLDLLLEASERDVKPWTMEQLREEIDTFLFAGHETTAAAITWALFCIGNEDEVQKKINEEFKEVFADSKESVTLKHIVRLKYLERVIKEVLRLYPSVPSVSRTLTEDIKLGGYKVPKGCNVDLLFTQLHRDPEIWHNPDKFDPDRFLPENIKNRHPYAHVPFSAGPRNCIGQKFAMLEQKIVLTTFLRKWKVKSVQSYDEIKIYDEFTMKPQNGVHLYITAK